MTKRMRWRDDMTSKNFQGPGGVIDRWDRRTINNNDDPHHVTDSPGLLSWQGSGRINLLKSSHRDFPSMEKLLSCQLL